MTYTCTNCGYIQDFDPSNVEQMQSVFQKTKPNIKGNQCPSCNEEDAF